MTSTRANFDLRQQRAGIRRTAWIVGSIAFGMFVLFIVKQLMWH